jgi:phosphate transport system permease protein
MRSQNNRRRGIRKFKNACFAVLCFLATCLGVVMLAILLVQLFRDGMGRLTLQFLRSMPHYLADQAGILSPMLGSVYIMLLTGVIAVPVGVAAAIYLEEFTVRKNRFVEFIQTNISNLAGVPSIVYGLLGLAIFVRAIALGESLLAGALTMSLLILPMVILISQEALRAVPRSYRDGALALGCTRWQTIRKQVLPCAWPGILTGIILSMSRAIGETAPLIVVGAVGIVNFLPKTLEDRYTVLPIQIFLWSQDPRPAFHEAAAGAIIVLMVTLLLLNSVAIFLRQRSQNRF